MRQLDNLKQTGSVQEYYERFEQLSHNILLYNASYDDVYFVTRFMGGLREEICAPIALHRPKNVDAASALALFQEEELECAKRKPFGHSEVKEVSKLTTKPSFVDKHKQSFRKDDSTRFGKSDMEDKVSSLLAQRKKLALCYKCDEKWGQNHKCPQQVPLHVLEELLDMLEPTDDNSDTASDEENNSETPVLAIDTKAPLLRRKTMRLLGKIGKQQILILVDSGSIGTFVSTSLVQKLKLPVTDCAESIFKSANGGLMVCNTMVPELRWMVQGHTFCSSAKVLDLHCYDMILG